MIQKETSKPSEIVSFVRKFEIILNDMKGFFVCLAFIFSVSGVVSAQNYELKSTAEIYGNLQKLERGMRVLYVAAHPDDENTRMISWLENDQHIQTAYLSLTRGQGGQNLIGDEKGDALGVIRTYELLEARKVDGGEQFFTRAVDFGYSKSAEESFDLWGKEDILRDVVFVIRKFRPHVIITRFPPTAYAGHGHHTASAILAEEAFDLAADQEAFADQLEKVQTWQCTALFHNASSWWDKSLDDKSESELLNEKTLRVNVGVYNPILGESMTEIAASARSKHRCQAFGTPRVRGAQTEYLRFVKGTWDKDIFQNHKGIWHSAKDHPKAIQNTIDSYDFTDRSANIRLINQHIIPVISQRSMWADPQDIALVNDAVGQIISELSGVRVEAYTDELPILTSKPFIVEVEVYNSGDQKREITLKLPDGDTIVLVDAGSVEKFNSTYEAPKKPSSPFWLRNSRAGFLYNLEDDWDVGKAVKPEFSLSYILKIDGQPISCSTEIHRKWNDRSIGQRTEPLIFVEAISIQSKSSAIIAMKNEPVKTTLLIRANDNIESARLQIAKVEGWEIKFDEAAFSLNRGQIKEIELTLIPTKDAQITVIFPSVISGDQRFDQSENFIRYDHIPEIVIHQKAFLKLIPLELNRTPKSKVLYIEGSGDEVDEAMELMGYLVEKKSLNGMSLDALESYDAIVVGIRAFNVNLELAANIDLLHDYVKNGGNMIVQYNTTYDLKTEKIAPGMLKVSRDRVTDENATVRLLQPKHVLFNSPNKLVESDWSNWVQERGLYFAGEWDDTFQPLISWSDKGEEAFEGALLLSHYGKGTFIYTGISFFRQLPAGVPGAYRLFANMIEYNGATKNP